MPYVLLTNAVQSQSNYHHNDPELHKAQQLHVAVLSLLSFTGRISIGLLSDWSYHSIGIPYATWAVLSSLLMTTAFLISIIPGVDFIYVSILIGLGFGSCWTITPTLVGQYFGQRNFGRNWGWLTVVPAFGGSVFSYLFGIIFDSCEPAGCFIASLEICIYFCSASVATSLVLWFTR